MCNQSHRLKWDPLPTNEVGRTRNGKDGVGLYFSEHETYIFKIVVCGVLISVLIECRPSSSISPPLLLITKCLMFYFFTNVIVGPFCCLLFTLPSAVRLFDILISNNENAIVTMLATDILVLGIIWKLQCQREVPREGASPCSSLLLVESSRVLLRPQSCQMPASEVFQSTADC